MQATFQFDSPLADVDGHSAPPVVTAPAARAPGRGAAVRPANPHERVRTELWRTPDPPRTRTVVHDDSSQSIVVRNESPDLPFRWTLNPYRGCEHGCSYCYARPTHEFLGFDAGIGFESQLLVKRDAPELLRRFLRRPRWQGEPIVFSGVTDCYQPIERDHGVTRGCLEVAEEFGQPVSILTKNALVTRDTDLLVSLAKRRAAVVSFSITTLDERLSRAMEPRTSTPRARLRAMRELAEAGVPVHAMLSPTIPGLNDHEAPAILEAVAEAGARSASYTLLRLSGTVRDVFLDWLDRCEPRRAPKVRQLIQSTRGGALNDTRFGYRLTGAGPYAGQIARAFRVFAKRNGLSRAAAPLSSEAFGRAVSGQRRLF
ncbi:MAG: PA0069 family radical SAM protein [Planctomycetota bacterium]